MYYITGWNKSKPRTEPGLFLHQVFLEPGMGYPASPKTNPQNNCGWNKSNHIILEKEKDLEVDN